MGLNEGGKVETPVCESSIGHPSGVLGSCCISSEPSEEFQTAEIPRIIPCFNGKSLKIHEELVVNGLSAISIKHNRGKCEDEKRSTDNENQLRRLSSEINNESKENQTEPKKLMDLCYKDFRKADTDIPDCLKDQMKRRNSFWNIHRPELSKLTWPENFVSSALLQDFFHNHMRIHGTFCEPLHEFSRNPLATDEELQDYSKLREIIPPRTLPPDEKVITIMEKSRSVQLNDEDLDPQTMVHKSRAEFCVTIGEYVRRPPIKRTTSQQMPKLYIHPNRFEFFPINVQGLLSKEALCSQERLSAVVGNTGIMLRRANTADIRRLTVMSPTYLNNTRDGFTNLATENGGDPARLRTIFSPRNRYAEESRSWPLQILRSC